MGQLNNKKTSVVIICLVITSMFVYWKPSSVTDIGQAPLEQALLKVDGWQNRGFSPFGQDIIDELELDDYANHLFTKGNQRVELYIGYYYSTKKIGAAHSPLVCFPGQGWVLSKKQVERISVQDHDIHLAKMIITRGNTKNLIIYWYQSLGLTAPGTFRQKINTLWGKYVKAGENNAFVRVSVPMNNISVDEAYATGKDFIKSFYPEFYRQVSGA